MIGSESTAQIARGLDLPVERLRAVRGGERFTFGRFAVEVFRSRHSRGSRFEGEIDSPLRPPAPIGAYREGGAYSFLIERAGEAFLVHPSANFVPGQFAGTRADVLFLGVATLGKQGEPFLRDFWRETVRACGARRVVPIHWDDFLRPLDEPLAPMPLLMDELERGMRWVQRLAGEDGVAVHCLPAFEPVDVLAALH